MIEVHECSERVTTQLPTHFRVLCVIGFFVTYLLTVWFLGESASAARFRAQRQLQPATQQQANKNYRVRKVEIKGAGNLASNRIAQACRIWPNGILRAQSLEICKEHALHLYLRAGFIRAVIEIQPLYSVADANASVGVVDILITVSEGAKYYVGAIEFQGNHKTRHRIVQRATRLHLEMPYDPLSIKKWVGGLNRLALFETVRPEDVEIEFDEQDHAAYLRFHLREK